MLWSVQAVPGRGSAWRSCGEHLRRGKDVARESCGVSLWSLLYPTIPHQRKKSSLSHVLGEHRELIRKTARKLSETSRVMSKRLRFRLAREGTTWAFIRIQAAEDWITPKLLKSQVHYKTSNFGHFWSMQSIQFIILKTNNEGGKFRICLAFSINCTSV